MPRAKGTKNKPKTKANGKIGAFSGYAVAPDSMVTLKEKPFVAYLKVFGRTYEAEGATISEAVSKLMPGRVMGKAILTMKKGEVTKERILPPFVSARLFNMSGMTREIQLKNVSMLFEGFA